jgi:replicative DNA helicase
MSWELISHIVQHPKSYKHVMSRKVEPTMFGDERQQRVFEFIAKHYGDYKKVPGVALLGKKFPKARVSLTVDEPIAFYLDNFMRQHLRSHGSEMLIEAAQNLADDPFKVFEDLREAASAMLGRNTATEDIDYVLDWKSRLRSYNRRERGEMLGIPTPFETWNNMTFGYNPQDFIIITARPGVGKTFFMLHCALHAAYKQHKKVLFFTKEMSIEAVARRSDAMQFELPYNAFRKGALLPSDKQRWIKGLKRRAKRQALGNTGQLMFVADANMSVLSIEAKIEEYQPDVVFIDGLYLLRDLKSSVDGRVRVENVSREVRSLAQAYNIPVIASSQIHRMPGNLEKNWQNLTLGDLAFSDALSQDADVVLALIRTEDMRMLNQLMVKPLKIREDDPKEFGVSWNLTEMKNTFHEISINPEGDVADQVDRTDEGVPIKDDGDRTIAAAGGWDEAVSIDDPKFRMKRAKLRKKAA